MGAISRTLPGDNEAGLDLASRYLSSAKTAALRSLGLSIVQGRRDGVRVWDLDGNAYLDCRSAGGVFDFGHRPQFAIDALTRALEDIGDIGDWLLFSAVRARGAESLARVLPGDLHYSFFTPGGGEAIEVACKLARAVTGRAEIVTAEHGFHGQVGFALAMDEERETKWFEPLVPGITKVRFGDLGAVDRAVSRETAAVCMETVPATAGYPIPPDDFWPGVEAICRERGALMILDEVQAGLGRTGTIWACEHWGAVPDLLVTGKGLSGGVYPISACCFGDRVDAFLGEDPIFHPSSFGGSELGAAVVTAVVDTVTAPGFLSHVRAMGDRFAAGFDELCARHPTLLVGHRGLGLMRALDTCSPGVCGSLALHAIENGVLAIWANNRPETLLVMPPLVIRPAEVDEVIDGIGRARGDALMLTPDLETLEADVVHAIATGDASALNIVGHGEISLVLGWPPTNPEVVCKRLPPFPDVAGYRSYREVVLRYIDELRGRRVRVVDTDLCHLVRRDKRVIGFHVQPLLPADRLGTEVLRRGASTNGQSLLEAVVEAVDGATSDRLGIDAQLSNWIWLDAVPWQIDLTTPFLLDDNRRPSFDLTPFLASLPAFARPIVRREMAKLILRWTTSRGALLDLAANLLKEELSDWIGPALRTINAHVSPPIAEAEAERVYLEDRRLWPLLFHLEHFNRWWQRRIRRREFDFLLPARTTYEEHRRRTRSEIERPSPER